MAYARPLDIIFWLKKTTELVLLFHKKTTKLVFLWPNMGHKSIKMLKTIWVLIDFHHPTNILKCLSTVYFKHVNYELIQAIVLLVKYYQYTFLNM